MLKVLVVEDDPSNTELLRVRLKNAECEAVFAATAEEGLALARSEKPGLILMDLNLYGDYMRGAELVTELRSDPLTAGIPIAVHSVYAQSAVDAPSGVPPVEAFLPKPFRFRELVALLDRYRPPGA